MGTSVLVLDKIHYEVDVIRPFDCGICHA